jgi:choice-of-anchor C domain-containing protein
MKRRLILPALLGLSALMSTAVTGVLAFAGVINGGFEAGAHTAAPFDTLTPGDTQLTGWTIESGSVDWVESYWVAASGSRSIDLNGAGPGALSQALATTVDNTYTVTFEVSGNPACGPTLKTLSVAASGADPQAFAYDTAVAANTVSDMKWESRTYSFIATSSSSVLTFTSTSTGSCGPALDSVVVTETIAEPDPDPTPEPGPLSDCKHDGWQELADASEHGFRNQGDCVSYVATDGKNVAADKPSHPSAAREARREVTPAQPEAKARDTSPAPSNHEKAKPEKSAHARR